MMQSVLALEAYNQIWTVNIPFARYLWMIIIIITAICGIYFAKKFVTMF